MYITQSTRKDKRYMAVFDNNKKINFGLKDGSTFIDHGDKNKRDAYIKRHQVNENFNDPYTAGALSRWILWGDSKNINNNINFFKKKFNV